jgi:hypothetical protein
MTSNDLQQQLHTILTSLEHTHTDDPQTESQLHRTINIYIEVEDQHSETDQPPIIESILDDDTTSISDAPKSSHPRIHQTEGHSIKRQRRAHAATMLFLIVPLVGLLAGSVFYALLVPMWTPSASVTIVTTSQQLTTSSTLQVVTEGTADPSKDQIAGRTLASVTMSQQKTVPTTGTTRQAAQTAHGIITFYNGATYSQTIPAGTVLVGADNIQLVTNADAHLPAAVFPTFGQANVTAHAAILGTTGNVRAGDVYGACCRLNVSAVNSAFYGGQNARSYQSVTQQDINGVVTSIKTSLEQSVQAALLTQVQPSETLITPLPCAFKATPNHEVGEEATEVQVLVSETCTGTTYTNQALTKLTTQRVTQNAEQRLGTGYTTTGVQSHIFKATQSSHNTLTLQVQSVSLWTHPFSQEQQDNIKTMIAGMSKNRATAIVTHMAGVQSVSITLKNGTTIPNDVHQIHLLFLQI